jgi:hypothetical protein
VINDAYHMEYHRTTVHSNKTPCVTRCRLTSHYILPAEYNMQLVERRAVYPKLSLELVRHELLVHQISEVDVRSEELRQMWVSRPCSLAAAIQLALRFAPPRVDPQVDASPRPSLPVTWFVSLCISRGDGGGGAHWRAVAIASSCSG